MKKKSVLIAMMLVFTSASIGVAAGGGTNSCGYTMDIIPIAQQSSSIDMVLPDQAAILDAWTSNDPFNPNSEIYSFTRGQEPIAFVVKYHHVGGVVPEQWARGWTCGNESQIVKTCNFKWTASLPAGDYLLINYFNPVNFAPGEYDWAAKVGNVVYGWPNISASRPWCFSVR